MPLRSALRRVLGRDLPNSGSRTPPSPGDLFIEKSDCTVLWEVERILELRGGQPGHVVLRDPDEARPRRLVSQAAFIDTDRFVPVDKRVASPESATAA